MAWYKRSCCSSPIRSCMLCSAGANGMRSDQWQKTEVTLFSRFGLVVLWWMLTKSSSAYMTCKKLCALLCWCLWRAKWSMTKKQRSNFFSRLGLVVCSALLVLTAWKVIKDKKNRGHAFFQDLDWLSYCEQWQSLHLLIWHVRSCMLCSASSNDMRIFFFFFF